MAKRSPRALQVSKYASSGSVAKRVLFVQAQLACSGKNAFPKNVILNFAARYLKCYGLVSVGQVFCAIWTA